MKERMWRDGGQVLVQVALGLVVLLLVVGLAIDGGNVYAQRRAMQNAADAGALAGARAICAGNPGDAAGIAIHYAEELNGADVADVSINGGIVDVLARKDVNTFLMGLAGFDTVNVVADAEATCGRAEAAGGLFPVAFDEATWDTIECQDEGGPEVDAARFVVWADQNDFTDEELCVDCDCEDSPIASYGGVPLGPGQRGWLKLKNPPDPEDQLAGGGNCGSNALSTWVEHNYPAAIPISRCVSTAAGDKTNAVKDTEDFREGDIVNVLIYENDATCELDDLWGYPESYCNPGPGERMLRVVDFGCVRIVDVDRKFSLDPIPPAKKKDCPNNEKVIYVTRICGCDWSATGWTDGSPVDSGVPAVSLTK